MLRSIKDVAMAVVVVAVLGALVTFDVAIRIALYRNTTELELLNDKFTSHVQLQRENRQSLEDRVTALEKTLYAPLTVPEGVRKPTTLEQWITNADTELRKRIKALEDWRFKQEAER